jgi:hypothetical protein
MKKGDLWAIFSGLAVTCALVNRGIGGFVNEMASNILWGVAVVSALFAIGEYIKERPR